MHIYSTFQKFGNIFFKVFNEISYVLKTTVKTLILWNGIAI